MAAADLSALMMMNNKNYFIGVTERSRVRLFYYWNSMWNPFVLFHRATAHPWHEGVARTRTLETLDFCFFLESFPYGGKNNVNIDPIARNFHLRRFLSSPSSFLVQQLLLSNAWKQKSRVQYQHVPNFSSAKTLFRIASSGTAFSADYIEKRRRFNWPDFLFMSLKSKQNKNILKGKQNVCLYYCYEWAVVKSIDCK